MLSKNLRMKSPSQFDYIFKKGNTLKNNKLLIFYSKSKTNSPKIGIVVSKKIGKSTVRNKVKRRLRETVLANINILNKNYNYIFVARCGIENLKYSEILSIITSLIKKSEVYV